MSFRVARGGTRNPSNLTMLATPPPAGANTILVGHLFNIQAAANVSLPEGGAAVFEPLGQAGFRFIESVSAEEWSTLAQP